MKKKAKEQALPAKPKPNILSRACRLIFIMAIIYLVMVGSTIRLEYNPERAKEEAKTWIDHLKKVASAVKIVKPLF